MTSDDPATPPMSSPGQAAGRDRLRLDTASTIGALVALLAGWGAPYAGLPTLALPLFVVAYAAAGWEAAVRGVRALRAWSLDVDILMLLAAAGAAVVGEWLEGAILLFLFSLGNTLETFAFRRTRRSIESLIELRPEEAIRLEDGQEAPVRIEALSPGDIVRVRPGDRIPVDGVVVAGASAVDESTLTGEPTPVDKHPGAPVYAGTLNATGFLDLEMTRAADDTALARIITLVEEAREARAPTQGWIEAVEGRYAAGVIVAAGVTVLVPWLLLGWPFDDAFYRAMTLLVVASPCALVISIPATIVSAVATGARHGILFKGGAHLDALSEVRTFALDKTGTVTVGHPEVVGISDLGPSPLHPDQLLRLVGAAEARSEHHLAAAIVRAAADRGIELAAPEAFESIPGRGVVALVDGVRVAVGRRSWVEEVVGSAVDPAISEWLAENFPTATPVWAALDGHHAGAFAIQDYPRPSAPAAIQALRDAGIERIVMLTGDAKATAEAIGMQVGIEEIHAGLQPQDKSAVLETLARHGPVAMVGDGVNDAPALAVASVGIAIGAAGTDVALETADVVVMGADLGTLAHAVRLSQRTRTIVRQNLIFALGVMAVLVVSALMGWIGLTLAVLGHEGSTVIVVFNGLRLLAHRPLTRFPSAM
jgi:Cd2+/Zn2+-exporting ATPase